MRGSCFEACAHTTPKSTHVYARTYTRMNEHAHIAIEAAAPAGDRESRQGPRLPAQGGGPQRQRAAVREGETQQRHSGMRASDCASDCASDVASDLAYYLASYLAYYMHPVAFGVASVFA